VITIRIPQGTPAPESYHHGVEVSGDVRTLYIAGQIGLQQNGTIPEGKSGLNPIRLDVFPQPHFHDPSFLGGFTASAPVEIHGIYRAGFSSG
jgi:hypothetical protein